MIVDFHTHVFPQRIAEKAMANLAKTAGNVQPCHNGTVDSLLAVLERGGASHAVVLNIATNEKQQKNVNDFAIELNRQYEGRLTAFGSVHPDSEDALRELERLHAAGVKGIKLHPDYQHFFVDEERLFPLYRKIAQLGFITVFHAGVDIGYPEPVHCTPQRLAKILPALNGAPVVAAHMGGWLMWEEVETHLAGQPLYLDTAFSSGRMPPDYARRIVEKHGANRVLLGSDMPWSATYDEIQFVRSLGLSETDEARILGKNAMELLGL